MSFKFFDCFELSKARTCSKPRLLSVSAITRLFGIAKQIRPIFNFVSLKREDRFSMEYYKFSPSAFSTLRALALTMVEVRCRILIFLFEAANSSKYFCVKTSRLNLSESSTFLTLYCNFSLKSSVI